MYLSARRRISFYVGIVLILLLCFVLGTLMLIFAIEEDLWAAIFGLLFYFIGITGIHSQFKHAPSIIISDEGITLRGVLRGWATVTRVDQKQLVPFKYLWSSQYMDGATIHFNDGTSLVIFYKMYTNAPELIAAIESRVALLGAEIAPPLPDNKPIDMSNPHIKRFMRKMYLYATLYIVGIMSIFMIPTFIKVSDTVETLIKIIFVVLSFYGAFLIRKMLVKAAKKAAQNPDSDS